MVHHEAQAVLYCDNLLISLALDKDCLVFAMVFKFAENIRCNVISPGAPILPAAVHIRQRVERKRISGYDITSIVFAAADFRSICHTLHEVANCGAYSRWIITVLEVPRHGWTSEQLREVIWNPLRRRECDRHFHVIDRTGVFEARVGELDVEDSPDIEENVEW